MQLGMAISHGSRHAFCCAALLALTVTAGVANGAIVPVLNSSFESPITATFTTGVITDWTGTGEFGVFRPSAFPASYGGAGTTDGEQVGYSNGGLISQTLSSFLTANTFYTLQVDVGNRLDLTFPGYTVGLYAGGTLLAQSSSPTPPDGSYLTSTVAYVALPTDSQLGQALEIRLTSNGVQVNFDNVRLDAAGIPEPSTMVVLGLGAFGLVLTRLRRRR